MKNKGQFREESALFPYEHDVTVSFLLT